MGEGLPEVEGLGVPPSGSWLCVVQGGVQRGVERGVEGGVALRERERMISIMPSLLAN